MHMYTGDNVNNAAAFVFNMRVHLYISHIFVKRSMAYRLQHKASTIQATTEMNKACNSSLISVYKINIMYAMHNITDFISHLL